MNNPGESPGSQHLVASLPLALPASPFWCAVRAHGPAALLLTMRKASWYLQVGLPLRKEEISKKKKKKDKRWRWPDVTNPWIQGNLKNVTLALATEMLLGSIFLQQSRSLWESCSAMLALAPVRKPVLGHLVLRRPKSVSDLAFNLHASHLQLQDGAILFLTSPAREQKSYIEGDFFPLPCTYLSPFWCTAMQLCPHWWHYTVFLAGLAPMAFGAAGTFLATSSGSWQPSPALLWSKLHWKLLKEGLLFCKAVSSFMELHK